MPKSLSFALAALCAPALLAQTPSPTPRSEADLLKQIQALTAPAPSTPDAAKTASPPASLFDSGLGDTLNGEPRKGAKKAPEKKGKGPTEITALEATFDQKANVAVFSGDVIVKDPEFNVMCDKLTAQLKSEKKKPAGGGPAAVNPPAGDAAPKKKSGGLEKAIAESTSDRRVVITQEKVEDGNTTMSIGKADRATYDVATGDIVLTGTPEVQQGINLVLATSADTVMTLNRDGRMRATGATKTVIKDKGDAGL